MKQSDIDILRRLGAEKAEIAALPVQKKNIRLWTDTNDLKPCPAPVFINELPGNEMNFDGSLDLQCEDPLARGIEWGLRWELYCWKNLPGTMVVSPYMESPLFVSDTGIGITEDSDLISWEPSGVASRRFHVQISDEKDIEKIKDPVITLNKEASDERLDIMKRIFDGVIPVYQTGVKGMWFTPWDNLIRLTGVEEAMTDLIDRPDYVEALVSRFVDSCMVRMKQYNELNLWASNNNNTRVGSGGYGYTSSLPDPDDNRVGAPTSALWGCGNAQIFSEVSPQMHWDFSLKYEMKWLSCFGMNYYGCCEQLHHKIDILSRIPNLRKISMSPWADIRKAAPQCAGKYVLSIKPNPAIFISWDPEYARKELRRLLSEAEGCSAEIIMKDVSTLRYHPENLFAWAKIAVETAEEAFRG